jgi:translation initiation factor IF-3
MDYYKQFEHMLEGKRKEFKKTLSEIFDKNIKLMMIINSGDIDNIKKHIEESLSNKELDITFLKTFVNVNSENEITKYIKSVLNRIKRDNVLKDLGVN